MTALVMGLGLLLAASLGYVLWRRERHHRELAALHAELTACRQTEERLRISEERHRLLADNAMDVIWTMEFDGTISYVSPLVGTVTASFGVAELQPHETLDASFQRVDQALYTAKSAGRNRVCQGQ